MRAQQLPVGTSAASFFTDFCRVGLRGGGHFQWLLDEAKAQGQRVRPLGVSEEEVFPLPLVGIRPLPRKGRLRARAVARLALHDAVNAVVIALNLLFTGGGDASVQTWAPTAAQRRALASLTARVRTFLRSAPGTSGESFVCRYLRESPGYQSWVGMTALPLGERAGVPECAAGVDLSGVLREHDPVLAHQVEEPRSILLPCRDRPKLKRPFIKVHSSYPALVARCVRGGLQKLVRQKHVFKVRRRPLLSGAFAVEKDPDEDRSISAMVPLNQMVNQRKIRQPRFAMMPRLRGVVVSRKRRLRLSKKDARHYFHTLRVGRKWAKFMAHPPVEVNGELLYPVHQAVPMGFTASCSWAQAASEEAVRRAALPDSARLVEGQLAPARPPLWGSIIDDLWAVEEEAENEAAPVGPAWMHDIGQAWSSMGVRTNEKKDVFAAVCGEAQGAFIDGNQHWCGVSTEKRVALLQGGLRLLSQREVTLFTMERWVGKIGFAQYFKVCCRSVFSEV